MKIAEDKVSAVSPVQIAEAALKAIFVDFDIDAAERLISEEYIQHNPGVPTGRAPVIALIPALKESGIKLTIHRVIAEGDFVVFHNSYENAQLFGAPAMVAFDVFRIHDGRVVEHWDNLSPVAAPNPSARTQTDGTTVSNANNSIMHNKALVSSFIQRVLKEGEFDAAAQFIDATNYAQHNSNIVDGLDGLSVP